MESRLHLSNKILTWTATAPNDQFVLNLEDAFIAQDNAWRFFERYGESSSLGVAAFDFGAKVVKRFMETGMARSFYDACRVARDDQFKNQWKTHVYIPYLNDYLPSDIFHEFLQDILREIDYQVYRKTKDSWLVEQGIDQFVSETIDLWRGLELRCDFKCCGSGAIDYSESAVIAASWLIDRKAYISRFEDQLQQIYNSTADEFTADEIHCLWTKYELHEMLTDVVDALKKAVYSSSN